MEAALEAIAALDRDGLRILRTNPRGLARADPSPDEILLLNGTADLDEAALRVVAKHRRENGGVLWLLDELPSPEIAALTPVEVQGIREAGDGAHRRLRPADPEDPLLRGTLASGPAALERVGVRRWLAGKLRRGARAAVVVDPDGDPALVEGDGGRSVALLVPVRPRGSDLALPVGGGDAALVPLLASALERLAPPTPGILERASGEDLPQGLVDAGIVLAGPGGRSLAAREFSRAGPGVWRVVEKGPQGAGSGPAPGGAPARVVVSPPEGEGELRRAPGEEDLAAGWAAERIEAGAAASARVPLLALLLALLVGESALAAAASKSGVPR